MKEPLPACRHSDQAAQVRVVDLHNAYLVFAITTLNRDDAVVQGEGEANPSLSRPASGKSTKSGGWASLRNMVRGSQVSSVRFSVEVLSLVTMFYFIHHLRLATRL